MYIKTKEEEKKRRLGQWQEVICTHTYIPPNEKACPMQNTCTLQMWWNDMPSLSANLDYRAGGKTKLNSSML